MYRATTTSTSMVMVSFLALAVGSVAFPLSAAAQSASLDPAASSICFRVTDNPDADIIEPEAEGEGAAVIIETWPVPCSEARAAAMLPKTGRTAREAVEFFDRYEDAEAERLRQQDAGDTIATGTGLTAPSRGVSEPIAFATSQDAAARRVAETMVREAGSPQSDDGVMPEEGGSTVDL